MRSLRRSRPWSTPPPANASVDVMPLVPDTMPNARDGRVIPLNVGTNDYGEYKFKRTTWFGSLEEHIARDLMDRVHTSRPIAQVDHSGAHIRLTDLSDDDVLTEVLAELDGLVDGQATPAFNGAVVQNWSAGAAPPGRL